jgi:hypothetical protein
LTNTLVKEQEQKAALEEQLTGIRQKLTNQSQDLQVLRRDLTKQKAELQQQTEGREGSQTLLHEKQGECTSLRLEIEQVSTKSLLYSILYMSRFVLYIYYKCLH